MAEALADSLSAAGVWGWSLVAGIVVWVAASIAALAVGIRGSGDGAKLAQNLQVAAATGLAVAVIGIVGTWRVSGSLFAHALTEQMSNLATVQVSKALTARAYVLCLAIILPVLAIPLAVCCVFAPHAVRRDPSIDVVALTAGGIALGILGLWAAIPSTSQALSAFLRAFAQAAFTAPSERDVVFVSNISSIPSLLHTAREQLYRLVLATGIPGAVLVALAGRGQLVASRRTLIGAALWLALGLAIFMGTRGLALDQLTLPATRLGQPWEPFTRRLPPPVVGSCGPHRGPASVAVVAGEALDPRTGLPEPELAARLLQTIEGTRLDLVVAAADDEPVSNVLRALSTLVPRDADVRLWAAADEKRRLKHSLVGEREYWVHGMVPLLAPTKEALRWKDWVKLSSTAMPPEPTPVSRVLHAAESEAVNLVDPKTPNR